MFVFLQTFKQIWEDISGENFCISINKIVSDKIVWVRIRILLFPKESWKQHTGVHLSEKSQGPLGCGYQIYQRLCHYGKLGQAGFILNIGYLNNVKKKKDNIYCSHQGNRTQFIEKYVDSCRIFHFLSYLCVISRICIYN